MEVHLTINGLEQCLEIEPQEKLIDTLRQLGYKGVKKGCGEGTCGACTVLVDGRPMLSCAMYTAQVAEREVLTIEGLGTPTHPHPLQEIFVREGAVQCGFCTPGMLLVTKALLDKNPAPTEEEIKHALDGNLCRCTGYVKIIKAVQTAAAELS